MIRTCTYKNKHADENEQHMKSNSHMLMPQANARAALARMFCSTRAATKAASSTAKMPAVSGGVGSYLMSTQRMKCTLAIPTAAHT